MTSYSSRRYSQHAMSGLHPGSAFIIQFRTDSDPATDKLAGRIEHVASGKTANFGSVDDVPELLRQMLKDSCETGADGL